MRLVHAFCLACLNLRNEARKGSILKCAPRLFSCTHPRREALLVAHNANITEPSYAATKCVDIDFALN
jgi:hypothetical protein